MEANRRSKRKPLSDCTNIIQNHRKKPPPPSSSSKNPNSITLIKPPKPSNVTATTISNKVTPPTSSSQKSHTSIGSNTSTKSVTVPSIPHSPEPPAPPTPLSDSGGIDRKVSGLSADQCQQDDETRRKEKGKMVADTSIIPFSVYMTSKPLHLASSSPTSHYSRSGIQAVQSQKVHAQTIKDKGKTTVNASDIQLPKNLEISSSSISGSSLSETSVVCSQELHEERRKDKGKMVLETPNIEKPEPSTPHAPLASSSMSGGIDRKVSGLSADQSQRDDETRRKEKGKMVADTSIIPFSVYMTSKPLKIASSSATGHYSRSGIQAVQSQKLHAQTRKDKGKTAVNASDIQLPAPLISKHLEISSSSISGSSLPETSVFRSQELHGERRDKGKTVSETPNIEETEPSTPHALLASPATSGGIDRKVSGLSADQSQRDDETRRKEKGKMVADTSTIPFSVYMTSKPLQIASSSATGHYSRSGIQAVQSQNLHAQTRKDKGKTAVNASDIQLPAPLISKHLEISSSTISGSSLSETSVVRSQELHEERRKDKGKTVSEAPNIEETEPSTPRAPLASPATSGTHDNPVTIYSQRRGRQGRKHAVGKNNLSLSCSEQRIRKTGLEFDDDRGHKKGSNTDPLPVHKKKRSRDKHGSSKHVMPQEEVDKLRAYYADLDTFELPEEVVSESDLE